MRIGIIASSHGSAFRSAYEILTAVYPGVFEFVVLTDRPCGIEDFAQENNIVYQRIHWKNNAQMSQDMKTFLDEQGGVDFNLLYFSRLVTEELFNHYPTFNIHPALLPAFPGFNAVEKAHAHGARYLGATLHLVDAGVDSGPIVAQASTPVLPGQSLEEYNKFSYLQKVYLMLVLADLFLNKAITVSSKKDGVTLINEKLLTRQGCNPGVSDDKLHNAFLELQRQEVAKLNQPALTGALL